jgi:hypothetical protein
MFKPRLWRGMVLCAVSRHDWEGAPALTKDGTPSYDDQGHIKPGQFARCCRPRCRVFGGLPKLLEVENWLQTDDFMVLANKQCRLCFGRGYSRQMLLPGAAKAKMPCTCLRIQPAFVRKATEEEQKRGKRR